MIAALIAMLAHSFPPCGHSQISTPVKWSTSPSGQMRRMLKSPTKPKKRVIDTRVSLRIRTLRRIT